MATATLAMAGMWRKPGSGAQDAVFASIQSTGQEVRTQHHSTSGSAENVTGVCRLNDDTANSLPGRLPNLSESPRGRRRGRGRRRLHSRSWQEKKTDSEFDMVLVPPDGCSMSGSDSDDSDWSVGWFEHHPPDFTAGNDGEESFGVLVQSYSLPASEFSYNGEGDDKDSTAPSWASVLAHISCHTNPESQKQLDLWLDSLTK